MESGAWCAELMRLPELNLNQQPYDKQTRAVL